MHILVKASQFKETLIPQNFHADEDELKKMAELVSMKYKNKKNYIFNLGSGLTPDINPEKVGYFLGQLSSFRS